MSRKEKRKTHSKKRGIGFFIFPLLSLGVAIYCIMYIVQWYSENNQNKEVMENIYEEIVVETNEETGTKSIDFAKLKEKNPDTVGWLKINGTTVDYPVVKSTDNSYYLERNFNGESNLAGWIFADYRAKADGTDSNLVIYGHNMKDGSMFGSLKKNMFTPAWYDNEENLNITYETESEILTYRVFSVYETPDDPYFTKMSFGSDSAHQEFLDTIKSRSKKDFGVEVTSQDKIMTLSTCGTNGNTRCVLHAKLSGRLSK